LFCDPNSRAGLKEYGVCHNHVGKGILRSMVHKRQKFQPWIQHEVLASGLLLQLLASIAGEPPILLYENPDTTKKRW
jgi:hypothetical protein